MNESQKPIVEIVAELEKQLFARGQSPNAISQYHYIFQVFLAFFRSHHETYFSEELMKLCLQEHYGIEDAQRLSRRQSYKKKVIRASRMVEDMANGRGFADRYYDLTETPLLTDEFNAVIIAFSTHLNEIGRSQKTVNSYQRYASRFLNFVEQSEKLIIEKLSVNDVRSYIASLSGMNKVTVKSTIGPVRIFLRYLYLHRFTTQDLSQFVTAVKTRTQTKIPSVWEKNDVLKLLSVIDRGNPSGRIR